MTDREKERSARNKSLIARMAAAPTEAQILAELDLEISHAIDCAVAAGLRDAVRLLRMVKLEVSEVRQRRGKKDKPS
jgi:hypothetical protein